ncbi:beta strand repeat-containing protein [Schumannella soli]|uniref:DUF320 domain-containing protein n=1 Tax=Schumannella soli TaxID=2590779 RepID=A0A506XX50_9MICO|nr:hypothetical protein [Schumannella soli]TPW74000.1 hypothetical protein FJ657_15215 [Schumannella soli]
MNRIVSRGLMGVLFTGGLMALGCGVANAAEQPSTDGTGSVAGGTQALIDIDLPIDLSGVSLSVLGDSSSTGSTTAPAAPTPAAPAAPATPAAPAAPVTSGSDSLLGGSQALVNAGVPITVSGNSISVVGDSASSGSTTSAAPAPAPAAASTDGSDGTASGTQALIGLNVPITVSGNAISVLGDTGSSGATTGAATDPADSDSADGTAGDAATTGSGATTSGSDGILGGTQIVPNVGAPVTVAGNAISLLGDSATSGSTVGSTTGGSGSSAAAPSTSGVDGIAGGTRVVPDVAAPVTLGGNAISLLGDSTAIDSSTAVGAGSGSDAGDTTGTAGPVITSGDDGILSGTQVAGDVAAPVTLGGNAISVLGDSATSGSTVGSTTGATGSGTGGSTAAPTTSGSDGIAGGTQVAPNVGAPVTLGGNAISVLGDSTATDSATAVSTGSGSGATDGTGTTAGAGASTSGGDGVLSGTQVLGDVAVPVTVGGNAISVLGDSATSDSSVTNTTGSGTTGTAGEGTGTAGGPTTSGSDGTASGTQVVPEVGLPITASGNAISVVGDSTSTGSDVTGGIPAGDGSTGGATTDGSGGIAGGTQIAPILRFPILIGGNAVSVVGDSTTEDTGTSVIEGGDPTDPTDPTDPVDPGTPTVPGDGASGDGSGNDGSGAGTGIVAQADGVRQLASTGVGGAEIALTAVALLLGLGVILLMVGVARRRSA